MRKTFGRKSREKVEHPSARMMPNQKKSVAKSAFKRKRFLKKKEKRRRRRRGTPATRRPRGWESRRAGCLVRAFLIACLLVCLLWEELLPPVLRPDLSGQQATETDVRGGKELAACHRSTVVDGERPTKKGRHPKHRVKPSHGRPYYWRAPIAAYPTVGYLWKTS